MSLQVRLKLFGVANVYQLVKKIKKGKKKSFPCSCQACGKTVKESEWTWGIRAEQVGKFPRSVILKISLKFNRLVSLRQA